MPEKPFRVLEHTADTGFETWGRNPAELFGNAARAMLWLAAGDLEVSSCSTRKIRLEAQSWEDLLVEWLNEILFLFDSGEFVPAAFDLEQIDPSQISATLQGEPRDPQRHPWQLIVKGVTYHQLEVSREVTGWRARVILDI